MNKSCFALQKRLFYNAKPTLLPCKRAAFGMRKHSFHNALIDSELYDVCTSEKYLHFISRFDLLSKLLASIETLLFTKS
ncbi:hypothetical protein CLI70_05805 [Prevotella intermedia]|uniref:Uncharacterized protein n=1 Tax=Prevotella intermedia TaxID=28131 RepID=A0A2A6EMC5_PREIN|nr:hypothetical protein CLI71_10415 [Prevotella intermedia]PDP68453.1 hypothetical protein CLI70_05805 [Prevotella intermedia]